MADLIDNRTLPPRVPRTATVLLVVALSIGLAFGVGALLERRWLGVLAAACILVNGVLQYAQLHRRVAAARRAGADAATPW